MIFRTSLVYQKCLQNLGLKTQREETNGQPWLDIIKTSISNILEDIYRVCQSQQRAVMKKVKHF
jgi:hypothetical protein